MATLGKFAQITADDRLYDNDDEHSEEEYYAGFGYGDAAREQWRYEWEMEDHYAMLDAEYDAAELKKGV